MKKLIITGLTGLAGIGMVAGISIYAFTNPGGQGHENTQETTATEMTMLGVAAASILGAGTYVIRRGRSKDRD
jgi:hypothetical protein